VCLIFAQLPGEPEGSPTLLGSVLPFAQTVGRAWAAGHRTHLDTGGARFASRGTADPVVPVAPHSSTLAISPSSPRGSSRRSMWYPPVYVLPGQSR